MNQDKRGRMVVDYRFLMNHPEAVLRLFAEIGFLPIRINHDMMFDTVEYAGISETFRELSVGEEIPAYTMLCEAGEGGEIKRVWVEESKRTKTASCSDRRALKYWRRLPGGAHL